MTVLDEMNRFAGRYGRDLPVEGRTWRYYRLGAGPPVLWLTGGLRRAALGFGFMEALAARHTVIAPDYPPVRTVDEFVVAFDAILRAEGVTSVALVGQSYGGLLAQAYLARRPEAVDRLVLSSTGPADYGKAWLPVEYAAMAVARLLPEAAVKNLLTGGLRRALALPEAQRADWADALEGVLRDELTRADVVSHFAVAADLIRQGIVRPGAFRDWSGPVTVLSAANDPTQHPRDFPRYERLFGRNIDVVGLGNRGHAAVLVDPVGYVGELERALDRT
jgi:pimeloyl-ACP methyl ester carboxylesterase